MPLFGDISRFALGYEVYEAAQTPELGIWIYGRTCFWCGGLQMGELGYTTSLRWLLLSLDDQLELVRQRVNPRFRGVSGQAAWEMIDDGMFGGVDPENVALAIEEQWGRHRLDFSTDVLDRWKVFVVEHDLVTRLLVRELGDTDVREVQLYRGELEAAMRAARDGLEARQHPWLEKFHPIPRGHR